MNHRTFRAAALTALLGAALTASIAVGSTPSAPVPVAVPPAAVVSAPGPASAVAPAPRQVGAPTRVVIPAIGIDQGLSAVGLKPDGAMATPRFGDIGWYDRGPRPGAAGPAVIVAHVHGPAGDDVFARLHELRPGDRIVVRRTDGVGRFVVDAVEQTAKEALPADRIWNGTTDAVLRLITCGGTPDPVTRMYPENTIVYAHLVG